MFDLVKQAWLKMWLPTPLPTLIYMFLVGLGPLMLFIAGRDHFAVPMKLANFLAPRQPFPTGFSLPRQRMAYVLSLSPPWPYGKRIIWLYGNIFVSHFLHEIRISCCNHGSVRGLDASVTWKIVKFPRFMQ